MKLDNLRQLIKEELVENLSPTQFLYMMKQRKKNRRNKMNKLGIL
jgi:hypothetical protein